MQRPKPKKGGQSDGFSLRNMLRTGASSGCSSNKADPWAAMRNVLKRTPKKAAEDHAGSTDAALNSGRADESDNAEAGTAGEGAAAEPRDEGTTAKKAKVNNTIVSSVQCQHSSLSNYLQRPSEYMRDFVDNHAQGTLDGLLSREAGPSETFACREKECQSTGHAKIRAYRCFDCFMPPVQCKSCLLASHAHTPFHFVQEWDSSRRFWLRKPLTALGVALRLGHEGRRCEYYQRTARPMCIVSEEGIHQLDVEFCACLDPQTQAAKPEAVQLLEHGFWAASWTQPQTAFTIKLLKSYSLLANQAQVNSYDYFNILRRKTDNVMRHDVLVSASQDGDELSLC